MRDKITWTDVKISLPKKSMWVLVTYQEKEVTEAYYYARKKTFTGRDDFTLQTVKAWAEIPMPYEE